MLNITAVSKSFKSDFWAKPFKALDEVSFSLNQNSLTGFLGANGAGKTTLIKIILGFIKKDSGLIHFDKSMGQSKKNFFSQIGYVPERPYFYPDLTANEYLHYMGLLNRMDKVLIEQQIKYWSERLNIDFALNQKLRSFSKGMLQRLGFASSLIHDPMFLIMDEPLSGLDPIGRKDFKDIIIELNQKGKTVFFSSHIVSDVEQICQDVVVIEKGRIIYNGKVLNLLNENIRPNCFIQIEENKAIESILYTNQIIRTGEITTLEVPREKVNDVLRQCLDLNLKILSVENDRPRLEEIIYKIRS